MQRTINIEKVKKNVMRSVHSSDPLNAKQAEALERAVDENLAKFVVPDTGVYRAAVYSLALAVLIAISSAVLLAFKDQNIPDIISVVAGAAIGALAGMLSSNR